MSHLSPQHQARLSGRSPAGPRGARPRRRTAGPGARRLDLGALVVCDPQPILLGLHGQTHTGQGDAASGTTAHVSLRSSPFQPGPCQSAPTPARRFSQVQPNLGRQGHSPICPAGPSMALPLLSLRPPQRRPPPGPGPVPSLLGRAQPCPPLAQSLREDGGPVTGWCRRGSEHGARKGGRPVGGRGRPAHLSAARPARPAARGLVAAAPVPGDRAKHAGTAEEGDGKKRRHGRAGPETAKKSGRGLGSGGS